MQNNSRFFKKRFLVVGIVRRELIQMANELFKLLSGNKKHVKGLDYFILGLMITVTVLCIIILIFDLPTSIEILL